MGFVEAWKIALNAIMNVSLYWYVQVLSWKVNVRQRKWQKKLVMTKAEIPRETMKHVSQVNAFLIYVFLELYLFSIVFLCRKS